MTRSLILLPHFGHRWPMVTRSSNLPDAVRHEGSHQLASLVAHGAYWITSSARPSSDGEIVSPSAFAVFRLMTKSIFVGCSTGRSAGLAPLRIRSMYFPAREHPSKTLGP